MSEQELQLIAENARFVVCGYAFSMGQLVPVTKCPILVKAARKEENNEVL